MLRDPGADAGETIVLCGDVTVRVIGDSEETSRRVCYLLVEEKTLFTGALASHPAALSPIPIEGLEWIAPSHGFLIPST